MISKFGVLQFRMPISQADRAKIVDPNVAPGDGAIWPVDAVTISGTWPAPLSRGLMIRPVFPGAMRFIASNPLDIPTLAQIEANTTNGRIDDGYLETMQLIGTLVVRIQQSNHLQKMKNGGTIDAIGECPTVALYGPVRLTSQFLRKALLDFGSGMLAGVFYKGLHLVNTGDIDWEPLALANFLGGNYEPILRANEELLKDDAERLPMPELPLASNKFSVSVALGWTRNPKLPPSSANDTDLEIIPTVAFLRHIGSIGIRESINVDPLIIKLFENETDSQPWTDRIAQSLKSIGFGAIGVKLSLEQTLREFQISAASKIVAGKLGVNISEEQLALRQFKDLVAVQNMNPYSGAISGRANQKTRELIAQWAKDGLRCPLLIVAYNASDLDGEEYPLPIASPVHHDLWGRYETRDETLRVFAADFTRLLVGGTLTETSLEQIGSFVFRKSGSSIGGPRSRPPSHIRRIALAEVTPERLVGVSQSDLIQVINSSSEGALRNLASSFKVIRAVSEVECIGYLDQINAYDDAGISYGPCHWAMALAIDNPKGTTELGGLAAYLRYLTIENILPNTDVFLTQGMAAAMTKNASVAAPARKTSAASFVGQLCFIDDRGMPRAMDSNGVMNFVPSWRTFYRWVSIGRRDINIGKATWRMALRRLRRLAAVPIVIESTAEGQAAQTFSIGEAFNSELIMAQLMRWHVKIPGEIVKSNDGKERASQYVVNAYKAAKAETEGVSISSDIFASALIRELRVQLNLFVNRTGGAHAELPGQFDYIEDPDWIKAGAKNDYAYSLDSRLRLLSKQGGSLGVADIQDEP